MLLLAEMILFSLVDSIIHSAEVASNEYLGRLHSSKQDCDFHFHGQRLKWYSIIKPNTQCLRTVSTCFIAISLWYDGIITYTSDHRRLPDHQRMLYYTEGSRLFSSKTEVADTIKTSFPSRLKSRISGLSGLGSYLRANAALNYSISLELTPGVKQQVDRIGLKDRFIMDRKVNFYL